MAPTWGGGKLLRLPRFLTETDGVLTPHFRRKNFFLFPTAARTAFFTAQSTEQTIAAFGGPQQSFMHPPSAIDFFRGWGRLRSTKYAAYRGVLDVHGASLPAASAASGGVPGVPAQGRLLRKGAFGAGRVSTSGTHRKRGMRHVGGGKGSPWRRESTSTDLPGRQSRTRNLYTRNAEPR